MTPILGTIGSSFKIGTAFESIATATGTGSSGTITFSSIPSTYQHLQIRATCLSATAGAYVGIRFNSDSGTNYTRHSLWGTGAAVNAGNATSATEIRGYSLQTGTSNVNPNVMIFDVLDYASTSKNKTTRMLAGIDANGSGDVMLSSSLWLSTSAINRIDCILFTANYSTTTTFALYGIKGA